MPRTDSPTDSRTQVARRSLVRTGVTAAWAVPAVTGASAAPAFAACSGASDLSTSTHLDPIRVGKLVTVSVTLKNTGSTTAALKLAVTNSSGTLDSLGSIGWGTATAGA